MLGNPVFCFDTTREITVWGPMSEKIVMHIAQYGRVEIIRLSLYLELWPNDVSSFFDGWLVVGSCDKMLDEALEAPDLGKT